MENPQGTTSLATPSTSLNKTPEIQSPTSLPDWYPSWARELAELYFTGNTCLFVLTGNVNDFVPCGPPDLPASETSFCDLIDFMAQQLFGSWDIVVSYDLGRGIQTIAGADSVRHQNMMQYLTSRLGNPMSWTRDPDQVLGVFDKIIQRNLLEDEPGQRKRIAFLFPYSQYLIPAGDHAMLSRGTASRLVRLLSWAQNPYIKRVNTAFFLIAEAISEVNSRLVQNPHVAAVELPLPDEATRRAFVAQQFERLRLAGGEPDRSSDEAGSEVEGGERPWKQRESHAEADITEELSVEAVTKISNGLNLVNLNVALSRSGLAVGVRRVNINRFRTLKKGLIERQCQDLVSFIEPTHNLDMVVGHVAAKQRLRQDGRLIAQGQLDAAPMGYLICGPVGTGKTFLAECYAGTIGIPCLALRNFRSKYVGETEGNLEKVLTVLRSLGPVVVIVDEADAALGNREMGGDSGTSSRVFSMIASQMGNTRYRGQIIWMLLTSRPELLPIDLKRQGRAEVHIPLFYPQDSEEIASMFRAMAKKNKIAIAPDAIPDVSPERNLSGADIESVLLDAKRNMMSEGRDELTRADLENSLEIFIPSAQGLEKQLQEMAAVLECTDRRFLTQAWQEALAQPNGRSELQQRIATVRNLLER